MLQVAAKQVVWFGLATLLVGGCSARSLRTDLDLHQKPDAATGPVGNLMSERDRSALATLSASRNGSGRDGYRIGPDDLLDIRIPKLLSAQSDTTRPASADASLPSVTAAPVFQQGVRVSAQGDVTLPLLGAVRAAGRTPTELQADIARRLVAGGILKNPQVSVQIAEHRSAVVAVVGSVERPGLYPLTKPGATLADMVWAAGGPNKEAGRLVTFTPSEQSGTRGEPIVIDLNVLSDARTTGANAANPTALAGDVITVSPAGSVQVDGWVDKPGAYPVTRGLTVSGAVAAAGGHLFPPDHQHTTVRRVAHTGEQQFVTVDLEAVAAGRAPDVPVTDGDLVHLPISPGRAVPWGTYEAVKGMIRVGASIPII